jgi:hypothetical protein
MEDFYTSTGVFLDFGLPNFDYGINTNPEMFDYFQDETEGLENEEESALEVIERFYTEEEYLSEDSLFEEMFVEENPFHHKDEYKKEPVKQKSEKDLLKKFLSLIGKLFFIRFMLK